MTRDIIVKVGFNEDEYLAMAHVAESEGLSHSALLRTLVKARIRAFVMAQLSDEPSDQQMPEVAQNRAYCSTENPVSLIKGAL